LLGYQKLHNIKSDILQRISLPNGYVKVSVDNVVEPNVSLLVPNVDHDTIGTFVT